MGRGEKSLTFEKTKEKKSWFKRISAVVTLKKKKSIDLANRDRVERIPTSTSDTNVQPTAYRSLPTITKQPRSLNAVTDQPQSKDSKISSKWNQSERATQNDIPTETPLYKRIRQRNFRASLEFWKKITELTDNELNEPALQNEIQEWEKENEREQELTEGLSKCQERKRERERNMNEICKTIKEKRKVAPVAQNPIKEEVTASPSHVNKPTVVCDLVPSCSHETSTGYSQESLNEEKAESAEIADLCSGVEEMEIDKPSPEEASDNATETGLEVQNPAETSIGYSQESINEKKAESAEIADLCSGVEKMEIDMPSPEEASDDATERGLEVQNPAERYNLLSSSAAVMEANDPSPSGSSDEFYEMGLEMINQQAGISHSAENIQAGNAEVTFEKVLNPTVSPPFYEAVVAEQLYNRQANHMTEQNYLESTTRAEAVPEMRHPVGGTVSYDVVQEQSRSASSATSQMLPNGYHSEHSDDESGIDSDRSDTQLEFETAQDQRSQTGNTPRISSEPTSSRRRRKHHENISSQPYPVNKSLEAHQQRNTVPNGHQKVRDAQNIAAKRRDDEEPRRMQPMGQVDGTSSSLKMRNSHVNRQNARLRTDYQKERKYQRFKAYRPPDHGAFLPQFYLQFMHLQCIFQFLQTQSVPAYNKISQMRNDYDEHGGGRAQAATTHVYGDMYVQNYNQGGHSNVESRGCRTSF